jgi:hypothetical protein
LQFKNRFAKRISLVLIVPFVIIGCIDLVKHQSGFSFAPTLIEFLVFIVYLIFFFFERMNIVVTYPLYQSISFWIAVGLLIYFSGNFFIFLLSNYSKDKSFLLQLSMIYSIVTITKNILFSSAFFAHEQHENSNDNNFQFPEELNLDSFNLKNTYQ